MKSDLVRLNRFAKSLEALIAKWEDKSIKLCGPKYASFKDVRVWDAAKSEQQGHGDRCVCLTFDGSGYDELSISGMLSDLGSETYRTKVFALAAKHGLHGEDYESYMMTFSIE